MAELVTVDVNDLTVGEMEDIEEVTGTPFDVLFDPAGPKGKMLRAAAWIIKRRNDPDFTFEQARDLRVNLSDVERPTEPSGQ
ncbi:hypothetical protein GCM10012275_56350 [Longimycelium tulufanense]|uniref:Uncharacterized protein n=1 Tax=Longimycelium tulufanense TaxID=907463 RepID=A0A8J3CJS6_9PSEU|nr:hypothetical protein [Longimycelium tulufanense]GGM78459.1 hypothetical protein GCM10012275_56350 [Longimycelium tulufanense]